MSDHLTTLEQHDAVYGFAEARHDCPTCSRSIAALRSERAVLEGIFAAPLAAPRSRSKGRWIMVPLAASLIAGLAWLLSSPLQREPEYVTPGKTGEFAARMAEEFGSGSPARREAAEAALRAMGGAAVEALEKTGSPEAKRLADQLRTLSNPAMEKLRASRISLTLKDIDLSAALSFIVEFTGVNILLTDLPLLPRISLEAENQSAFDVLSGALAPLGLVIVPRNEILVICLAADAPQPPSRLPLRLRVPVPAEAERRIAELGSDAIDVRRAAMEALIHPGAEDRLWSALDHPDPGIVANALSCLGSLYRPSDPARPGHDRLAGLVELDFRDSRLGAVLSHLHELSGLALVTLPGVDLERPVNFRAKQISVDKVLAMILSGTGIEHHVIQGAVVLAPAGRIRRTAGSFPALYWTEASAAGPLGDLINRSAAGDRAAGDALAAREDALPALRYAQKVMDRTAAERLAAVADRILALPKTAWYADEPAAWRRLKRPSAEQSAIIKQLLEKRLDLDLEKAPLAEALAFFSQASGIPVAGRKAGAEVRISAKAMAAGDLLDLLTLPHGLEASFDGPTLTLK